MNIEIANRLVTLRKSNGLSQEALAEKLGISRQAVSKWERAEASPDTDNLIALANLYTISLDELLALPGSPPVNSNPPAPNPPAAAPLQEKKAEENHTFTGIHLKSRDGEVYLGRNGIAAQEFGPAETLHSKDTARIIVNGQIYTFQEARRKWGHQHRPSIQLPLALIVGCIYVAIGVWQGIWHPTWLLFLLVPIFSNIAVALRTKNWQLFPYSLSVTAAFLSLGFLYKVWHPAWILFLTIPLFYSLRRYCRPKEKKSEPAS